LQFISDPALDDYFLLLLLLVLRLSSLNWVSGRRVSILPPYHHRHPLRTLAVSVLKNSYLTYLCASGHHPLSMLQYLLYLIGSYGYLGTYVLP